MQHLTPNQMVGWMCFCRCGCGCSANAAAAAAAVVIIMVLLLGKASVSGERKQVKQA